MKPIDFIEAWFGVTFMTPFLVAGFLFVYFYLRYIELYRKKRNPDYPLLPGEIRHYFEESPRKVLKEFPMYGVKRWKVIFEKHHDAELDRAARKARHYFLGLVTVALLDFFGHIMLFYFLS